MCYAEGTVYIRTVGHEKVRYVQRRVRDFIWPKYMIQMKNRNSRLKEKCGLDSQGFVLLSKKKKKNFTP